MLRGPDDFGGMGFLLNNIWLESLAGDGVVVVVRVVMVRDAMVRVAEDPTMLIDR